MSQYNGNWASVTATVVAAATNFTDAGYPFVMQGGGSTQRLEISEVYIGGQSTSSTPTAFKLARDSTVAVTISGNTLALGDAASTAPGTVPLFGNASSTKPQRSSTLVLLSPSIDTYGGVMRWVAHPKHKISTVGNTASLGEISLSSAAGAGISSGHVIFEVA